jgi:hypothetical protein
MNYEEIIEALAHTIGPLTEEQKDLITRYLERQSSGFLNDKRRVMENLPKNKVQYFEFEVIYKILRKRGYY